MDDATSESTRPSSSRGRRQPPGAFRGDRGARAVRSMPTGPATTGTRPRPPKVDRDNLTQVGRALQRLGIDADPAYSPEARGRSERMFGTLKRRPQETQARRHHRDRRQPLAQARGLSAPTSTPASRSRPSGLRSFAGALDDILCVRRSPPSRNDNTGHTSAGSCSSPPTAIAAIFKATVRVHEYPVAVFHGPRSWLNRPAASPWTPPQPGRLRDRFDARPKPSSGRRTTCPPQAEAHRPVDRMFSTGAVGRWDGRARCPGANAFAASGYSWV